MAALQVYKIANAASLTNSLRINQLSGAGSTLASKVLRVYNLVGVGVALVTVRTIFDTPALEPNVLATQTAVIEQGSSGDITWVWAQLSGPAVSLTQMGASVSFIVPSVMPNAESTIVLGVTATISGVTSSQKTATFEAIPQTRWGWNGSNWVGAPFFVA